MWQLALDAPSTTIIASSAKSQHDLLKVKKVLYKIAYFEKAPPPAEIILNVPDKDGGKSTIIYDMLTNKNKVSSDIISPYNICR